MRLCILGDSHVGALKTGWDIVRQDFPAVTPTFFASPGQTLRRLRLGKGRLVPTRETVARNLAFTSGGLTRIEVADYDAFLIYGLNFLVPRLRLALSQAVVSATIHDISTAGLSQDIAAMLRSLSACPIFAAPAPLRLAVDDRQDAFGFHDYTWIFDAIVAGFPAPNVHFIPQPLDTFGPDLRTPAPFGIGSLRLVPLEGETEVEAHPPQENRHMNADYGAHWLRQALPRMLRETAA